MSSFCPLGARKTTSSRSVPGATSVAARWVRCATASTRTASSGSRSRVSRCRADSTTTMSSPASTASLGSRRSVARVVTCPVAGS